MRFWDTSALVPLLVREPLTDRVRPWFQADRSITVWWSTSIECTSAIARAEREGRLGGGEVSDAIAALRLLRSGWSEVDASDRLRTVAERLVRTHPLRAADACQLGAAILVAEESPTSVPFVTLDGRLAEAATREGFDVIGIGPL